MLRREHVCNPSAPWKWRPEWVSVLPWQHRASGCSKRELEPVRTKISCHNYSFPSSGLTIGQNKAIPGKPAPWHQSFSIKIIAISAYHLAPKKWDLGKKSLTELFRSDWIGRAIACSNVCSATHYWITQFQSFKYCYTPNYLVSERTLRR